MVVVLNPTWYGGGNDSNMVCWEMIPILYMYGGNDSNMVSWVKIFNIVLLDVFFTRTVYKSLLCK